MDLPEAVTASVGIISVTAGLLGLVRLKRAPRSSMIIDSDRVSNLSDRVIALEVGQQQTRDDIREIKDTNRRIFERVDLLARRGGE